LCDKYESEFEGFEVQNPNPMDSDFSWLSRIPTLYHQKWLD